MYIRNSPVFIECESIDLQNVDVILKNLKGNALILFSLLKLIKMPVSIM